MSDEVTKEHIVIKCSSCNNKLLRVFLMEPEAQDPKTGKPFQWSLKATCPYCGDESFPLSVTGRFSPSGYGEMNPDSFEDVQFKTFIDGDEINGKEVSFRVLRT